jgi:hypothetical protein
MTSIYGDTIVSLNSQSAMSVDIEPQIFHRRPRPPPAEHRSFSDGDVHELKHQLKGFEMQSEWAIKALEQEREKLEQCKVVSQDDLVHLDELENELAFLKHRCYEHDDEREDRYKHDVKREDRYKHDDKREARYKHDVKRKDRYKRDVKQYRYKREDLENED